MIKKIILWLIILGVIVGVRLWNIEVTARFIWDESSDLVRMQELYKRPKITLLGPMSEDKVKIFSSLTYYLSLPFVMLGKFEPISPVWATVFFGTITALLFLWLSFTENKKYWWLAVILMIASYPLLQASRWAWNPHFIPFWEILGLTILLKIKKWWGSILGGLVMGMAIHQHYYAVFAVIGFGISYYFITKSWKRLAGYGVGMLGAISPFVIFDITHPPGLFITRALFFSPLSADKGGFNISLIPQKIVAISLQFGEYLAGENKALGIGIIIGTILVLTRTRKTWVWMIPVIGQILLLTFVGGDIFWHYLLPAVIFYYWWLWKAAEKSKLGLGLLASLLVINFVSLPKIVLGNDWSTNIRAVEEISKIMKEEYQENKEPFNIAVLSSPDPNTYGRRYRDLLNIENIPVENFEKFSETKKAFFVSYKSWEELKSDPGYEMNNFRSKSPIKDWIIPGSGWKVYLVKSN